MILGAIAKCRIFYHITRSITTPPPLASKASFFIILEVVLYSSTCIIKTGDKHLYGLCVTSESNLTCLLWNNDSWAYVVYYHLHNGILSALYNILSSGQT